MAKELAIFHAASASGKTTFMKRGNAQLLYHSPNGDKLYGYVHSNVLIVDGDDLVSFFSSWPSAPLWWQSENRSVVHTHNYAILLTAAVKLQLPSGTSVLGIVFNGGMREREKVEELYLEYAEVKPVISHLSVTIPEKDHKEYISKRHLDKGVTTVAQARAEFVFPASWQDASNNRLAQQSMARIGGWATFDSFDKALLSLTRQPSITKQKEEIELPPDAFQNLESITLWVLKIYTAHMTAVKLRDKGQGTFISEVAIMSVPPHFVDDTLVLSASYAPYIDKQRFIVVPTDSEGFHISDTEQLWFFSKGGVEIRDDKSDVVSTMGTPETAVLSTKLTKGLVMHLDLENS